MKIMTGKRLIISRNVSNIAEKVSKAVASVGSRVIDRSTEIEAFVYCVVTKHHMMLEGPPGEAKSLFAETLFELFDPDEFTIYNQQFMKATQVDEIFGPMLTEKYKKGIWEYNIQGMLPSAHFAFLDEVYRASDMALPSILRILNERRFKNGLTLIHCPLITALGATNFTTENEELEAFHDRWLVKALISPMESPSMRMRMYRIFLEAEKNDEMEEHKGTVTLSDICELQRAVKSCVVSDIIASLFDELITEFSKRVTPCAKYSSRRLCWCLNLAQASALMANPDARLVSANDLAAVRYGLFPIGRDDFLKIFFEALESIVGGHEAMEKENKTIEELERFVSMCKSKFDPGMPKIKLRELSVLVNKALQGLSNMRPDEQPQTQRNIERLGKVVNEFNALKTSIEKVD